MDMTAMEGVLRCSRYAFGPNRVHYCGPDASAELAAQIGASGGGLPGILARFEALYPYLCLIARANHIADPFDARVVEAYWLGNELLANVNKETLRTHLKDTLGVERRAGPQAFRRIEREMRSFGLPHHAFHVLSVWQGAARTGTGTVEENVAECLVNLGEVVGVSGPHLTIRTRSIGREATGQWSLGAPYERVLTRQLGAADDLDELVVGDAVSYHWGVPCERLSATQAHFLRTCTHQSLQAVNQNL